MTFFKERLDFSLCPAVTSDGLRSYFYALTAHCDCGFRPNLTRSSSVEKISITTNQTTPSPFRATDLRGRSTNKSLHRLGSFFWWMRFS